MADKQTGFEVDMKTRRGVTTRK